MSKYLLSLSVHPLYKCKLQVIRTCKYLTCLMSVAHTVTMTNPTDTFKAVVSFRGWGKIPLLGTLLSARPSRNSSFFVSLY